MYSAFYNLTGKPFQLSPDPRFFFGSRGHKRAMSYLRYGLSQGEGFIVITGGIGTGKTTLVRNLFAELDSDEVVAAQLVTSQLEADDMLTMVVAAFGLAYEGLSKAVLIKRLEDFLASSTRAGKRVLLVVDEAQNLPAKTLEELRMLSNFQISDKPLLQSFLLGQEEFRATLQSSGLEQLRQRIIASCHLGALSVQETRDYVEHRLRIVGWHGDPRFGEDTFEVVHTLTEGIPRRINLLCDRLMLYGFLEELHEFDRQTVKHVGKELSDELPSVVTKRPSAGERGAASPAQELDHSVDALNTMTSDRTEKPAESLGQRVAALEQTTEAMRKGFVQLTRLVRSLASREG
jgi:putative secretion ATPase (PEP-CTERM system associated)